VRFVIAASLAAVCAWPAALGGAEETAPAPFPLDPSLVFGFDNDAFTGSDRYYTNGIHVGFVTAGCPDFAHAALPEAIGRALDALPGLGIDGRNHHLAATLTHRIFTPEDTDREELIRDDMPYSGQLVVNLSASAQAVDHLDAWTLTLGATGPVTQAEEFQNGVHDVIGANEVRGWDNQLDNEVLLNAFYQHRSRLWRSDDTGSNADLLGGLTVAAGNLVSYLDLGVSVRAGYQVPDDFAMPTPFLADPTVGSRPTSAAFDQRMSCYVFASVNATALANAIIWEGNTFTDSHRVDYDHHLLRGTVGVVWKTSWAEIRATGVVASLPFDNPGDDAFERFVRLELACEL